MGRSKDNKLNHLLSLWPHRVVLTSKWLTAHGYYNQLVKKYSDNHWITKIGKGAYSKLGEKIDWPGGLNALQAGLNLPVHIGGLTALEMQGLGQNIPLGEGYRCYLFNTTADKKPLPKWFTDLFSQCLYRQYHLFDREEGLIKREIDGVKVEISAPERAILELLALVPQDFAYEDVDHIAENLRLLRPSLLQTLLQQCRSIKTKRLFLYLADKHQLPCFKHLELEKIDLGQGKRVIGAGGHYISQYQLSVPTLNNEEEGIGDV